MVTRPMPPLMAVPGNKKAYLKMYITHVEYEQVMNTLDAADLLIKK